MIPRTLQVVGLALVMGVSGGSDASALQLNVVGTRIGSTPGGAFGSQVWAVPTLGSGSGDDVLVLELAGPQLGSLSRYGPQSQAPLWLLSGADIGSQMGINSSVAYIEDRTGDGVPDLLLGVSPGCRLIVVDGATGGQVQEIANPLACFAGGIFSASAFGSAVVVGADHNGDGFKDIYSGDMMASLGGNDAGAVLIIDAVTGALLSQIVGVCDGCNLGSQVIFADNSIPGVSADLIISSPGGAGEVTVFDSITLQPRFSLLGADPGSRFGSSIAALGDIDADGYSEIAVGAPFEVGSGGSSSGAAYVYSGQSGEIMESLEINLVVLWLRLEM